MIFYQRDHSLNALFLILLPDHFLLACVGDGTLNYVDLWCYKMAILFFHLMRICIFFKNC